MLRVGVVPYINALPLCKFLSLPIIYKTPAELDRQMEKGKLDVALLPSFSFLRNKEYKGLFEAGCIQSNGAVESVLLFTKKDPSQIRSIKFHSESITSVNLFKVIYSLCWKHPLENLTEKEEGAETFLYIGDKALFFEEKGFQKIDLGEVWHEWTGLPFVYALWVSQKELASDISHLFVRAKEEGLAKIDEIIASNHDLPPSVLRRYLTKSIQYEMTGKSLEGLKLFQEYCYQVGLLKEKRSL